MTILIFTAIIACFSVLAGLLGVLTGIGGGIIIIPVLVILFNVDIHYAIGASLISVLTTSATASAAYYREGFTNLRIGIFLELAAVCGAFAGALLIAKISPVLLTSIFCFVLFLSAWLTARRREEHDRPLSSHPWATKLKLDGSFPMNRRTEPYYVHNVPLAFALMGFGGLISGLLGIGAGSIKVLTMDQTMKLPFKVATATSNFMIGITAAVSAGIYFSHGYINPEITFPVMIGVLVGAWIGAKFATRIHTRYLRILFSIVLSILGLQMLYNTLAGVI